jgi:predicted MPP superfamily phosphohydrolase
MKEKFVPDAFIVPESLEPGRFRLRHPILIMLFSAVLIIAAVIYLGNNIIQVSHYTVKSRKIPKAFNGFKILQLSDLHSKSFGKENCYLIKKINVQNPDIIVMTGDMVDTTDTDYGVFIDFAV